MQTTQNNTITTDDLFALMSSKGLAFDRASMESIHRYGTLIITSLYNYLDHDGKSAYFAECRKLGLHVFISRLP